MRNEWNIYCTKASGETQIFIKDFPYCPSLEEAARLVMNDLLPVKVHFGSSHVDSGKIIKNVLTQLGTQIVKIEPAH